MSLITSEPAASLDEASVERVVRQKPGGSANANCVLVTGASGILGTALCAHLTRGNKRVVLLDRTRPTGFSLEDLHRIEPAVRAARPDWIIHAAANTNLDACEADPGGTRRLHVEASAELARAAAKHGCRLLYVSTDSVYNGSHTGPHDERSATGPVNHYARTKQEGEQACLSVLETTIVARVNFFGFHPTRRHGLASWLIDNLRAGRSIGGFTDVWFNPLYSHILADLLVAATQLPLRGGIYNFGASDACSKFDFARRFAIHLGVDPALVRPATLAYADLPTARPCNTVMNTAKLSFALGITPPSVDDGIDRLFECLPSSDHARLPN